MHTERRAYAAQKTNQAEYLIEDASWIIYEDIYIKNSLIVGEKLKAKVEIKVRSGSRPVIKEYEKIFERRYMVHVQKNKFVIEGVEAVETPAGFKLQSIEGIRIIEDSY